MSGPFDVLRSLRGAAYWRAFEKLVNEPDFEEKLALDFPREAEIWRQAPNRRDTLKLLAASLALAGLGGCAERPKEKILPYVRPPSEHVPGRPLYFASVLPERGYGLGVLVESHEGRPTKIEGNPEHPASLGATDARAQAAILSLYDPERSQGALRGGRVASVSLFFSELAEAVKGLGSGRGLRVLSGPVTSPTLARQLRGLLERYPDARWDVWSASAEADAAGARLAYGRDVLPRLFPREADVVVSFDGDLLGRGPGAVRYHREWAERRTPGRMNRVYAIESVPTLTGARADHRRPRRPSEVAADLERLLAGVRSGQALEDPWLEALRRDLLRHRGRSLAIAGPPQPADVHAGVHALNELLQNRGKTFEVLEAVEAKPAGPLAPLARELRDGKVDLLLILGANPVYAAPPDLDIAAAIGRARFSARLGLYADETSRACRWHIPEAHPLESWSDLRAFDGTAAVQQPLIAPLYGGRSAHELLAALSGRPAGAYELVRETWRDRDWERVLHDGIIPGTASKPLDVAANQTVRFAAPSEGLELALVADPWVDEGQHAENAWLQELPKPLTSLTWDNALLLGPSTAAALGLKSEDLADVQSGPRALRAPVFVLPSHPEGTGTLHLGYGRTRGGRVALGRGVNANLLRDPDVRGFARGVSIAKAGGRYRLAATQGHWTLSGRDPARSAAAKPDGHGAATTLYPDFHQDNEVAWGMSIDLSLCSGCSACVVACQAENNVPVVGKEQVLNSREMHWLRIDRYVEGTSTYFQPMLCQHCEKAPCEVVCPTNATVHSEDGLNQMVYNRCVGTRYCSNNCPYKVRRFNFLQYADWGAPADALRRNPDVSVRERGVMEKCTYCVQRIQRARIDAEVAGRPLPEIQTACAQACPAGAIVFGNIRDRDSAVARRKADPRDYGVLDELGTRPRTTYLAQTRNPNPELG